jgi:hypothetical protein
MWDFACGISPTKLPKRTSHSKVVAALDVDYQVFSRARAANQQVSGRRRIEWVNKATRCIRRDLLEIEPEVQQILPSQLITFDDDDTSHRHQNSYLLSLPFSLA